jgi:RNA polymerase nonessential primary-like sigma factor
MPICDDPTTAEAPLARLTSVEERVARGVVAGHRVRLDWMLRVPEWSELYAAGITALEFPGQRQGVSFQTALLALPLENKHQLVRWALEHCRVHVRSAIGRHLGRLLGLELFEGLELDEMLSARQWHQLREAALFRLGQEHRRYKHAQQLLFTGHHPLVAQVVAQIVFRVEHRADAAQEGALGLLAAIDRVDESDGSLAAYAVTWIRRYVRNHLLSQRLPVQAPVNLISEAIALHRDEEAETPLPASDDPANHRLKVLLLECLRHPAVALDEPFDDGGGTVAEVVADIAAESPADSAARADLCAMVGRQLGTLTKKQRHVLVRRFGLGGGAELTLSDIARAAGISHQQAGMRERRALQRLAASLAPLAGEWYGSD